jgi:predicted phage tail protein
VPANAQPFEAIPGLVEPTFVPGAPTAVTGTAGNAQVGLGWTAPASDGGSPVTGYRITPYIGAAAQTPVTTGTAATSHTVTGLTNGTAYTFTVAAINAVGTGPDSAASAPVTPSAPAPSAPGAPTGVTGIPGDGEVALSWVAPASDGGAAITGYRLTPYIAAVAQTPVTTPTAATTYTVTGLSNGTAYTFTVEAINSVGPGDESAPSGPLIPAEILPPVPHPGFGQLFPRRGS